MTYDAVNRMRKVEEKLNGSVKNTTKYDVRRQRRPARARPTTRRISKYTYDDRATWSPSIKNGKTPDDSDAKTTTFTYTPRQRGRRPRTRATATPSPTTTTSTASCSQQVEKKSSGTVVNEHTHRVRRQRPPLEGHRQETERGQQVGDHRHDDDLRVRPARPDPQADQDRQRRRHRVVRPRRQQQRHRADDQGHQDDLRATTATG